MRSMTAYAAVHQRKDSQDIQIVVRSQNFKYLDIAIRNLPAEDMLLEEAIKREIKKKIYRGKIEVFIFTALHPAKKIYIDEKTVDRYIAQIKALARKYNIKSDVSMSDILNLPQVISLEDKAAGEQTLILPVLKKALNKLAEFKAKEGKAIEREIMTNLSKLKNNVQRIRAHKPKVNEMENGKEDIDEEISLLSFYLNKLERQIGAQSALPQGKSIDFLTQEILRELNAASSKTKRKIPALLIVEAKNYLERIREQAQNVE